MTLGSRSMSPASRRPAGRERWPLHPRRRPGWRTDRPARTSAARPAHRWAHRTPPPARQEGLGSRGYDVVAERAPRRAGWTAPCRWMRSRARARPPRQRRARPRSRVSDLAALAARRPTRPRPGSRPARPGPQAREPRARRLRCDRLDGCGLQERAGVGTNGSPASTASSFCRRTTTATWLRRPRRPGRPAPIAPEQAASDEGREGRHDGVLAAAGQVDELGNAASAVDQRQQGPLLAGHLRVGGEHDRHGQHGCGGRDELGARPRGRGGLGASQVVSTESVIPTSSVLRLAHAERELTDSQRRRSNTASTAWSVAARRTSSGSTAGLEQRACDADRGRAGARRPPWTEPRPRPSRSRRGGGRVARRALSALAPVTWPSGNKTTPSTGRSWA